MQNGRRMGNGGTGRTRVPAHPFQNNPVPKRPGSDPSIDYGAPPPQFDNPFDLNDYVYDEDYRAPIQKLGPRRNRPVMPRRPVITGFADNRRIMPSETNLNDGNGPPWRESNLTGTGIVIKEMWSSSTVKRPHFVMTGNMDGREPYVDPKC